ncbi:MAG: DUF4293 domain-containing protein [Bacteroidaceae bacterium]|nr:DUF4293 domain-containing protein [Bacteroidaceae bacterium]
MIQRIQTLYLFLATVLTVACMSICIGAFVSEQGEVIGKLYNLLYFTMEEGEKTASSFTPWALFAILLISATLSFMNIFLFKYRALQMRVCTFCMILLVGWYIAYGAFAWFIMGLLQAASFRVGAVASFPCVSLILLYLAFRGILKDEKLVRSLDRLR